VGRSLEAERINYHTMATRESDQNDHAGTTPAPSLGATLLRVAWLAIILGLAMEVLLLLASTFGDGFGLRPLVAGLIKNVS
jgi:hypothetical protein